MIEMNHPGEGEWFPPVMLTVAQKYDGIAELTDMILEHFRFLNESGKRVEFEETKSSLRFTELLKDRLFARVYEHIREGNGLEEIVSAIAHREVDPYSAVEDILEKKVK